MDENAKRPKRRPGPRNDIPWEAVRSIYAQGGVTFAELARRFDTERRTISAHARRERWQTQAEIAQKAQTKIIDMTTRRALEHLGGEEAVAEQIESGLLANLMAIAPLYTKAARLLNRTFDRALRIGVVDEDGQAARDALIISVTQGETGAVLDVLSALSKFVRDMRLDSGIKEGVPTLESTAPKQRKFVFVVAEKTQAEAS